MVKLKALSIHIENSDFLYEVVNGKQEYKNYLKCCEDYDYGKITNSDIEYCRVWFEGDLIYLDYCNGRNGIMININKVQIDKLLLKFGGNIKDMLEYVLNKEFSKIKRC